MTIIRWDPFRNVNALQDRINRMFAENFPQAMDDEDLAMCAWKPLVDVYQTADGLAIAVDLPGVAKNDVSVEVKNNVLTIRGERRVASDIDEESYVRRERCCGTFQRSFAMKAAVSPDKINAKFKDGVLTIRVPSPEEEKPRPVTVNVE